MSKILLIDDDELFHQSLREILELDGHEVQSAANGKVAIQLYAGGTYDLIITDLLMPQQDGLQTIRDVKRLNPQVNIIAISGGGGIPAHRDYLAESRSLGARAAFQKPFDPLELLQTVRNLLNSTDEA